MRFEQTTSPNALEKPVNNFDGELRRFLKEYPELRQALRDLRHEYSRQEWSEGSLEFVNEIIPGGFEFILEGVEEQREAELKTRFQELMRTGSQLTQEDTKALLEEISTKNQEYLTSFERFLQKYTRNFVDNGLDTPKNITHPERNEQIERPPVSMLNRAGFFQKLETKIFDESGNYNRRPVTVLNADITKLRNSDMVKDSLNPNNPYSYADILLQDTAKAFADLTKNLDKYLEIPEGVEVEVGRYGGDEFVFSIVGDESGQVSKQLQTLIKDRLSLIEAYYLNEETGEVERKPAAIKNNLVEEYVVPTDQTRKEIFLHYLRQGLIFDIPQVEAVRDRFRDIRGRENTEALNTFLAREQTGQTIYPPEVQGTFEKIKYLFKKNPLDGATAFRAYLYDRKHKTQTTEQVLEVIERVLYDSLLRARVQDFNRFKQDLEDRKYSTVWGYDMKFIKEINDNISYADADLAIRSLWETITAGLSPEDQEAFTFSRRGGTFFVGLKQDAAPSTAAFEHLNCVSEVTILDSVKNPEGVTIPIGTALIRPTQEGGNSNTSIRTDLESLFETMDVEMYGELLETIVNLDLERMSTNHQENARDYEVLAYKFFTGKRKQERINKLTKLVIQNRTSFKEDAEKQRALDRLEELRTHDSLPPSSGPTASHETAENKGTLISAQNLDLWALELSRELDFAGYPVDHKIAAVLAFENGPQTLAELSQVLQGAIPENYLLETLNRFDYLYYRQPEKFVLTKGMRKTIWTQLQPNEAEVAQVIFDGLHPKKSLKELTSTPDPEAAELFTTLDDAPADIFAEIDDFDFRNIK